MTDDDHLIAAFYESAVGRAPWTDTLDLLAARLDCYVVQIIGVDQRLGRLTYSFESRAAPVGAALDYALNYHREDPHVARLGTQPVGELVSFSKVLDAGFVAGSRFYQDFLIPYGVRHMHAARLFDDGERGALIGIMTSAEGGTLEGERWELARRLCFHLARALSLYEERTADRAHVGIGQAVLDRLAAPTWIVDGRRTIVRCNAAAHAAVAHGALLHVDEAGRLHATHAGADLRLGKAVATMAEPAAEGEAAAPTRGFVPLAAPAEGPAAVLRLLAIQADHTLHAFGSSSVAMAMLHDPDRVHLPDLFMLSAAFGMTPAEARVAVALAGGASPKMVAQRHGVSVNTVQTQIRRACEKAGVNRVPDLVTALHMLAAGVA